MTLSSTVKSPASLTEEEVRVWKGFMARQEAFRSPFYSPHYVQAVDQVRPDVKVCVIRSGDEPVAFFPFQFSGTAKRLLGAADPVGGNMTDYPGVVPAPGFRISSRRLLTLCGLNRYQVYTLEQSQVGLGLDGQTAKTGWLFDFSNGPDAYWEAVRKGSKRFVPELARLRKRITELLGPLTFSFEAVNTSEELERLVAVKKEHYRRIGADDALGEGWTVNLLRTLASSHAEECTGVLSVLRAGDRWVASNFGLRNGSLLHGWFMAYDHELSKFGPGVLIISFLINEGWNHGLRQVDAGCGDYRYKRMFGTYRKTYYTSTWYRNRGTSVALGSLAAVRRCLQRITPGFPIVADLWTHARGSHRRMADVG